MTDFETRYRKGPFGIVITDDEGHSMCAIKEKKSYEAFIKVFRKAMNTEIDARYGIGPTKVEITGYHEMNCTADIIVEFTQEGDDEPTIETWQLEMASVY